MTEAEPPPAPVPPKCGGLHPEFRRFTYPPFQLQNCPFCGQQFQQGASIDCPRRRIGQTYFARLRLPGWFRLLAIHKFHFIHPSIKDWVGMVLTFVHGL
jgi:hypothetical protein